MKYKALIKNLPVDIDCVVITDEINQRYATGFAFTDGYVLITHEKCILVTDSRYIEAAKNAVGGEMEVYSMTGGRKALLGQLFESNNVNTVGYEDARLTCAGLDGFKAEFPSLTFKPIRNFIEKQREIKASDEIEKIIKAQRIAEGAFDHILGYIDRDKTEKQVALELEFFMRSHGAEAASFDIIAVSGKASSLPHGVPRDVKLEEGFLTMDFGATFEGYMSDMTRTVCIGKADSEMKKIYSTVLDAQLKAIAKIKAGELCAEVDKTARDIISAAGYGQYFGHGLGHGVGVEIHESPRLSPGAGQQKLEAGHIVTIEPGIYLEGKYGVRIEDMAAVTENGYDNLTKAPKELIEIK